MASLNPSEEYIFTNNKKELDRLNYQHHLLTETFSGLFRAPLDTSRIHRVLDIGCGTGNWAIDFAKQHSHVEVLGFDISEASEWADAPPNCTLWVADLTKAETWTSFASKLDFIHGRLITPAVRGWPSLLSRCLQLLHPGGWIESQEQLLPPGCEDGTAVDDSKFLTLARYIAEGGQKLGLELDAPNRFDSLMSSAGYVNVKSEDFRMIFGPWPLDDRDRHLGEMGLVNMRLGLFNFTKTVMTKVHGWSEAEHSKAVDETLAELDEGKFRLFWPLRVCYAQKPVD